LAGVLGVLEEVMGRIQGARPTAMPSQPSDKVANLPSLMEMGAAFESGVSQLEKLSHEILSML